MAEKPLVLLIEDNPLDRRLVAALLEREGFDVEFAIDGETAIRIISSRASIIILDIILPTLSGFDVALWMQTNTPDLLDRLIIVTNLHSDVVSATLPGVPVIKKSQMIEGIQTLARNYLAAASEFGVLGPATSD